ncbi:MAG: TlpA family protein disulfide reductase [Dehalococcoidia bacterium]
MSKQRRGRAKAASPRPASSNNRLLLGGAVIVIAVVAVVAGLVASGRFGQTGAGTGHGMAASSDGTAAGAADAAVRVITGGIHTVRHTIAPLPTASTPREDGRPTLVWFSGTWCHFCENMAPYAQSTFAQFEGRMAFAEKSVDHDRAAASRFSVRGTPTFVLIDAQGRELSRFFYQPDAARLRQTVDAALKQAGL